MIKLTVRLSEGATGTILWTDPFNEEIKGPEDYFRIQSQIAKSIAAELNAFITPEEKQLIEKIPTISLEAYDFYQRGKDFRVIDSASLVSQDDLFHKALEYDSTFAQAYVALGQNYWYKTWPWRNGISDNFLDSVLILANIALSYDDQYADAYNLRGIVL